jgi:hypothetical protein
VGKPWENGVEVRVHQYVGQLMEISYLFATIVLFPAIFSLAYVDSIRWDSTPILSEETAFGGN